MRCRVAILLFAGAMAAQTNKPETKATISGVVKDTTGAPVAGITVSAYLGPETRTVVTPDGLAVTIGVRGFPSTTDETGSYSIANLLPGTYSVKTDRDPASKGVKVDAGQEVTVDFTIPANPAISGRVIGPDDNPAVDAFVWLLKSAYQGGVLKQIVIGPKVTGEDGSYSFDTGLEVNRRYYVLVDRPPPDEIVPAAAADLTDRMHVEVPTYYPSATRMDAATTVILQPGENREQVNVKIATAPFYCVEGKIQESGKPVAANFAIQEAPLAGTRLARVRGYADSDGKYHACGLSPGAYKLSTDEGFAEFAISGTDLQHVDLSLDTASPRLQVDWEGQPVVPALPNLNEQAQATLHKIAGLLGMGESVNDDDLKKLARRLRHPDFSETERDAVLKMQSEPDFPAQMGNLMASLMPLENPVGVMLTGAHNNFVGPIRDTVPSGDYTLEIHCPDDSYVKEVTYNDLKLADGVLRIAPAENGTLHVLMALGAAELTVAVADTAGKPVPNATVIVVPDSITTVAALSRVSTHGKTDQNGNYSLKSLAPGKYRVLATPQSVRWDVPEDLEKVLLVMFQAKGVELDTKGTVQISLEPVPIY